MTKTKNIYIGGWFQRTSLHLSEIYDFLKEARSPLGLNQKKLEILRETLRIKKLEMLPGALDSIKLEASGDIDVRIYEDGLIVLHTENSADEQASITKLTNYYEKQLSPAFSYIFSLGAPIPKELANIKTIYPYFVVLSKAKKADVSQLLREFGQEKYFEVKTKTLEIYRGDKLYIINNISETHVSVEDFINEQIFIREFKTQLHRYLNLHRIIWEKIADFKERGKIKGSDIPDYKNKIESYSKTINYIEARINQMDTYIKTRDAIVKSNGNLTKFMDILNFKYETLLDTLEYVKDIWSMTKNYVTSALEQFASIQAKSTENSVRSLAVITSMGVGATLLGLFNQKLPKFTSSGITYFIVVALIGYLSDRLIKYIYKSKMYEIGEVGAARNIK